MFNALFFTRMAILLFIRRLLTICTATLSIPNPLDLTNLILNREFDYHPLARSRSNDDSACNRFLCLPFRMPAGPVRLPSRSLCTRTLTLILGGFGSSTSPACVSRILA